MTTVLDHEYIIDGKHKPAKWKKVSSYHMHSRYRVCKATYSFLYGIGTKHRLEGIRKHYLEHGLETRTHKNSQQLPHHALSMDEIRCLVGFLENYAEQYTILLPGRIPGYKKDDLKLLPSSTSKKVSVIKLLYHVIKIAYIIH